MRTIVTFSVIIIFFILSLKSRVSAYYVYWWFTIFRPHDWVYSPLLISLKVPLIAAVLLVLPALAEKKIPKINHPIAVLMLLMLLALTLADLLNGCGEVLKIRTATVLTLFILFYIALLGVELIDSKKRLFWLIAVIAISLAFHSGKGGIVALLTGASYYGQSKMSGMFSGSNAYALGCGMILFFMIFTYQHINAAFVSDEPDKWYRKPVVLASVKLVMLMMVVGTFYNIVALESRGSFIATSLGLFVWVLLHNKNVKMILAATAVIALILTFAPMPEGYKERISSAFEEHDELDDSAASRPHFWRSATEMAKVYPTGVGPGCFPEYYPQFDSSHGYFGVYRSVHSSHFQILADAGYFGAIIWITLLTLSYLRLFAIRRRAREMLEDEGLKKFYHDITSMMICTMTVFIVGGAFYEFAYNDVLWLMFAMIIALEKILQKDMSGSEPQEDTAPKDERTRMRRF